MTEDVQAPPNGRPTDLLGGIEFSNGFDENGVFKITGTYNMPCGCVIVHGCRVKGLEHAANANMRIMRDRLIYWFENYVPWHDCKHVSKERPSSSIPPALRKGMTAPYAYLLAEPHSNHPQLRTS